MLIPSPGKGKVSVDEKLCYAFFSVVFLAGLVYLILRH